MNNPRSEDPNQNIDMNTKALIGESVPQNIYTNPDTPNILGTNDRQEGGYLKRNIFRDDSSKNTPNNLNNPSGRSIS